MRIGKVRFVRSRSRIRDQFFSRLWKWHPKYDGIVIGPIAIWWEKK